MSKFAPNHYSNKYEILIKQINNLSVNYIYNIFTYIFYYFLIKNKWPIHKPFTESLEKNDFQIFSK